MANNQADVRGMVDDLFADDEAPPMAATAPPGMMAQRPGNAVPTPAPMPRGGLTAFPTPPGGLATFSPAVPTGNIQMGGLNAFPTRVGPVGAVMPGTAKGGPTMAPNGATPIALPAGINATGFSNVQARPPGAMPFPGPVPGAGGVQALNPPIPGVAPNAVIPKSNATPRPQTVSQASTNAAMAKAATQGPAQKKQMTGDGGARARNADGSLKKQDDEDGDEEEELIGKEDETVLYEPIRMGAVKMSEEELRQERTKDEQRRLTNLKVIQAKLAQVCASEKVACGPKVGEALALALQRRFEQVMATVVDLSKRRTDLEADSPANQMRWVRSSNARVYLKKQEESRQAERENRLREKEATEKGANTASALDPSALRRQEEETTATVLEMGLARRLPTLTPSALAAATSSHQQSKESVASTSASIKERQRRVTLHDTLNFLLADPYLKHSLLTLKVLAGIKAPEPTTYSVGGAAPSSASLARSASGTQGYVISGATPTVSTSKMVVDAPVQPRMTPVQVPHPLTRATATTPNATPSLPATVPLPDASAQLAHLLKPTNGTGPTYPPTAKPTAAPAVAAVPTAASPKASPSPSGRPTRSSAKKS